MAQAAAAVSRVAYIRSWPRDPATGAPGLVAMAGGGSHLPYFLDNLHYRAGVVREPRFAAALGFDEKGWTGAALPTVSVIEFAPGDTNLLRAYAAFYWKDAAIEVDAGEEYAGVGRILTGTVADAVVQGNRLQITVADFGVKLNKPAIQSWFAGTGGIEGDATAEGRVKRRSYGYCANVEGRVLLAAWNIYEFGDPSRGFQSFAIMRDRGREGPVQLLGWQGSVNATLEALKAATPPQGGATVAPSIACVKWWTQPAGPLTADIQGENAGGYVETPVQIAARLLAAAGGPAIVNQAEAMALRNMVAGLHIGDDSETTAAALDRVLLPVSLLWRFGTTGLIDVRPWSWDGGAEVVQGRFIGRTKTLAPMKTRRLGYNRNHRQHSEGEIAADILAAGIAYADGTSLEQLKPAEGGANITGNHTSAAFAGQGALATRNDVLYGSHITSLPAAIDPTNLINGQYLSAGFGRYLDGVTMQALRPGEAGANVTEGRVSAAIAGQGQLATQSSLAFGSNFLTGFGSLAGLGNLFFGSPFLLESSGGVAASLSAFKTVLGTAAAIFGQGFGATASQGLIDNRQIQLGRNYAVNSRFARGRYAWGGDGSLDIAVETSGDWAGIRPSYRARFVGVLPSGQARDVLWTKSAWGGGSVDDMRTYCLPVRQNDRVAVALKVARHRCGAEVYCLVFNKNGALVQATSWAGGRDGGGHNGDPANYDRVGDLFDVTHTDAAYAALMARMHGTGEADPYIFAIEAQLVKVPAGTSVMPDYVDGPTDPVADQTSLNTAAAFTGQGPFATLYSLGFGSPLLTGFGGLAGRDTVRLGIGGGMVNEAQNLWLTDSGVITGLGTAAAITGQSAWATFGVTTGVVSRLQADGYMQANSIYLPNVNFLHNVFPGEYGANVTEGRTASAIVGQSAWATYGKSISQVVSPKANLFPYPRPARDGRSPPSYGWGRYVSQGDGSGWSEVQIYDGNSNGGAIYVVSRNGNYGACTLVPYYDLPLRDAQSWIVGQRKAGISLSGYCSNGSFEPIADWINADKNQTFERVGLAYNSVSNRYEGILNAPPNGTAYLRVYGGHSNFPAFNGYQDVCFWDIKVEPDAITPYSDASEVRSLSIEWATGQMLNSLRPGEFGANVTEGRTAAAISGQSAWATFGVTTNRVARIQDDGYLESASIYSASGSGGYLSQRWPQEGGANVTEGRTAAAFAGQGALATRSNIGWEDPAFLGRPQYLTDVVDRPGYPGEKSLRSDYVTQQGSGVALVNRWPQEAGANATEGRTAAAINGQGTFATQSWINSGNVASFFAYSAFRLEYNITRFDGTTIVTESMVITNVGIAAGFIGQGAGATANSLAQLDPQAQTDLNNVKGGRAVTYGYFDIKKIILEPGASINVSGAVGVNSGGTSNGNVRAQLTAGPAGSARTVFANGSQESVTPSEPAISYVDGIFVNNTGVRQLFEIAITLSRFPSSAGGSVNSAQSYYS